MYHTLGTGCVAEAQRPPLCLARAIRVASNVRPVGDYAGFVVQPRNSSRTPSQPSLGYAELRLGRQEARQPFGRRTSPVFSMSARKRGSA